MYLITVDSFLQEGIVTVGLTCVVTRKKSLSEIENVIAGFNKPRVQYMSISHSDSLSPIEMGTFTGSVKAMSTSPDLQTVLNNSLS